MIAEDYISFKVAKLLKEKGFTENTIGTYNDDGVFYLYKHEKGYNHNHLHTWYSAPTLQMTMKWLRNIHKLHIILRISRNTFLYGFKTIDNKGNVPYVHNFVFDSYEEACEAAIKYCLENLI